MVEPESSHATIGDETYDLGLLEKSHAKWKSSAALRAVYGSIYREMQAMAASGPALELGSGCGVIREFIPDVVTSDLRKTRFVDRAASAYTLDVVSGAPWSTIYLLDVLHHLREPMRFFAGAARVLRPGGRLVMAEPAATPWGRCFYGMAHHEPMKAERIHAPYVCPADTPDGEFANMAMAWTLFCRDRAEVAARLADIGLREVKLRFRDVLFYPASGGFSHRATLPAEILRWGMRLEGALPQPVLARLGLRMVVALERQ